MPRIEIKDKNNNPKGEMELPTAAFESTASEAVVHSAVVNYLANQRQGTHATRTRAMVSGGGKKPWKQKSTGRARHGSTRSPIWRSGGTTFGPQPRDYYSKFPKNMKRAALYKALTMKLADNEIVVVDSLGLQAPKTKDMMRIMNDLQLSGKSVLFVLPDKEVNVALSVRNIPGVDAIRTCDLTAYSVVAYDRLVFTANAISGLTVGEEVSAS